MDLTEKTIKSERIFSGRVIKLDFETVTLPNGESATREIVRHPGGVGVVAINENDEIYLVKQYRKPYETVLLEIPAGKLDPGENPDDAATRELSEETGLVADELKFIGSFYPSVGFCDENLRMYIAVGLKLGETHPDDDEFLNITKIPFEKAVEMCVDGTIKDGKTIAAVLKAKIILQK